MIQPPKRETEYAGRRYRRIAMRYVMKQKLLCLGDDFTVKDADGTNRFYVDGKALSIGDKLSFQDMSGNELAFIRQKLLSWGKTYEIYRDGNLFAVVKESLIQFVNYKFSVDVGADGPGPGDLEIRGDFFGHEYEFTERGNTVATVSRRWFSFADTYGVDVAAGADDVLILACTVVVDMCVQKHKKKE
jgi:uncharacterized protein YxjI